MKTMLNNYDPTPSFIMRNPNVTLGMPYMGPMGPISQQESQVVNLKTAYKDESFINGIITYRGGAHQQSIFYNKYDAFIQYLAENGYYLITVMDMFDTDEVITGFENPFIYDGHFTLEAGSAVYIDTESMFCCYISKKYRDVIEEKLSSLRGGGKNENVRVYLSKKKIVINDKVCPFQMLLFNTNAKRIELYKASIGKGFEKWYTENKNKYIA